MADQEKLDILMIDDNADDAVLVRAMLNKERKGQFSFRHAESLAEGMGEVGNAPPQVVLLDLHLPDSQGLPTVREFVSAHPSLPVIVLTGMEDQAYGLEAVRCGAEDYMFKPDITATFLWRVMDYAVQRKALAEALRENQERLDLILRGSRDGAWDWDIRNGTVFYSDRLKEMLGYGASEWSGGIEEWKQRTHPQDLERLEWGLRQYLDGEVDEFQIEHRVRSRSGAHLWILARGRALRDDQERAVRMGGTFTDLTAYFDMQNALAESNNQLRAAQSQLVETEKMRSIGRLSAGVAHEVKNPLATVKMGINFLEAAAGKNGDTQQQQVLEMMNDAVERADSILRGLLDYAVLAKVEPTDENLNDLIEQALMLHRRDLNLHHIEVTTELTPSLPPLHVDRTKILQVLDNLVENATHAMEQGGTLSLRTTLEDDNRILLQVQDTGHGISPDNLKKIYEPFFTTKPTGKGTGMGLTIVRTILNMHKAEIDMRNLSAGGVLTRIWFRPGREGAAETVA